MNTFRTQVPPSKFPLKISHSSQILCVGSCFTEHIGGFLVDHKFSTLINPSGIIYNPISITNTLDQLIDNKKLSANDLIENSGRYYHWDFHGKFSANSKQELVHNLNSATSAGHEFLTKADILFITLGTSFVFKLIEDDQVVANCHKFPNDLFKRELLSTQEITAALRDCINRLHSLIPNLNIVFTISPVRHIRDGLIENQRSKAHLITSAHQIGAEFENVHYFPSYELVMDDLRDYRFYKEDMIHVNEVAIKYIWQHFENAFFDSDTKALIKNISQIKRDCSHRAFHPETEQHQTFLSGIVTKIKDLQSKHPSLDFSKELEQVNDQLIA